MSFASLQSRALVGFQALRVRVEAHLANGLPCFSLVGLVDTFGKVLLPQVSGMLVYALMAAVLLYKPEGLFKQ